MTSGVITNFGGNESFHPRNYYAPNDESELLEVLRSCRGRQIRVVGRLHAWSAAAVTNDVAIDLRHLNDVQVERRGDRYWATVGAGCQIKRVLSELARHEGGTLPSLGLITEQSFAGAFSTSTHGSGMPSMSNFIEEVRIAAYDAVSGEPVIHTITSGEELRAARCSLGAMGVIISASFWARPKFNIEEHFHEHADLAEALADTAEYPRQQFYLIPWCWRWMTQRRRESAAARRGLAPLYRLYCFLNFDISLHLLVLLAARWFRSPRLIRFLFRSIAAATVIRGWRAVDDASKMLVMRHELFRHVEIEMFVTESRLQSAVDLIVQLLKYFDGNRTALSAQARAGLVTLGLNDLLEKNCGAYTHHYPICFRRVLPDDTLISMTSGSEPCYAISFISYARLGDRQGFQAFAEVACRATGALFSARPHWGKVCPLTPIETEQLYPQLPQFREVCRRFDSAGRFQNDWIARTLFDQPPSVTTPASRPS
jgi:hypothetical protein